MVDFPPRSRTETRFPPKDRLFRIESRADSPMYPMESRKDMRTEFDLAAFRSKVWYLVEPLGTPEPSPFSIKLLPDMLQSLH
jgi:hypothetical protein